MTSFLPSFACVSRQGATVLVMALQPSYVRGPASHSLMRRMVLVRPWRSPFALEMLTCEDNGSAAHLEVLLRDAVAQAPPRLIWLRWGKIVG
jgi:hypothetical protein